MIPKTIFQSHRSKELPSNVLSKVENMRYKLNPEYKYKLFDDDEMDAYVNDNFSDSIRNAYNNLNIPAAKCDFWRYLIICKEGGIYLDVDAENHCSLDKVFTPSDSAVVSGGFQHNKQYSQWALAFEAGHGILENVIDMVVENIETKRYPKSVLKTTGPIVYTEAIQKIHQRNFVKQIPWDRIDKNTNWEFLAGPHGDSFRILGKEWNGKQKECMRIFEHKFSGWRTLYEDEESRRGEGSSNHWRWMEKNTPLFKK